MRRPKFGSLNGYGDSNGMLSNQGGVIEHEVREVRVQV